MNRNISGTACTHLTQIKHRRKYFSSGTHTHNPPDAHVVDSDRNDEHVRSATKLTSNGQTCLKRLTQQAETGGASSPLTSEQCRRCGYLYPLYLCTAEKSGGSHE